MSPKDPETTPGAGAESKSEAKSVTYRYVGDGSYLHGVPARDLTKDDYDALSDEQKDAVRKSNVYEKGGSK